MQYSYFFASRMNDRLEDLRFRVHQLGKGAIWVAGHPEPEQSNDPEVIQFSCIDRVRECERLICVLDGSYGTPWNTAELSVLELEIFVAALMGKPMRMFLLKPFEPEQRLRTLLEFVRRRQPGMVCEDIADPEFVIDALKRELDDNDTVPSGSRWLIDAGSIYRRLVAWYANARASRGDISYGTDVQFLNADFYPLASGAPDKDLVNGLIVEAENEQHQFKKLVRCWMATRHLCGAPYNASEFREFLPLWARLLGQWSRASAWSGLHGHQFIGRLAAVNTSISIRERLRDNGVSGSEQDIHSSFGAIASEYYSIAKLVPSWLARRRWLKCALANVNAAMETASADPSGFLSIKGGILLALWHVPDAVSAYDRALAIRRTASDPGLIGEAEVNLGFACFFEGRLWRAEHLLASGLERLEQARNWTFASSALKKLGMVYCHSWRRKQGLETLLKAWTIAREHGIEGQRHQIEQLYSRYSGRQIR